MNIGRTSDDIPSGAQTHSSGGGGAPVMSPTDTDGLYRKIALRLLPFLFLAYIINSIDRANIAFAKLRMMDDLGLSNATYGLGASLFFVGYVLFEVPSNLYMQRVGARLTVMRIMILWGAITVAIGFVDSPGQLYVLRFLLGAAEAGFFPCIILYLTYWFPAARRGRITAMFMLAVPAAGMLSGPLATWIMSTFDGAHGLAGWRVLFIYEGIPAVLLGIVAWFLLPNGPRSAKWLTSGEREAVVETIAAEADAAEPHPKGMLRQIISDRRVWVAGFVFFAMYAGFSTITYWVPTLVQSFGVSDLRTIGLLTCLPSLGAAVGMIVAGRSSDRTMERRFHVAVPLALAGLCFAILAFVHTGLVLSMLLLTVAAAMCFGALPVFWTVPPSYLSAATAAGGIAFISSLGGISAFVTPNIIGQITTRTGSIYNSLFFVAAILLVASVVLVKGIPATALREHKQRNTTHSDA